MDPSQPTTTTTPTTSITPSDNINYRQINTPTGISILQWNAQWANKKRKSITS